MSEEVNEMKDVEKAKPKKKKKEAREWNAPSIKDARTFVTSKTFLIIIGVLIVLFVVVFPHTKTTKVNAEFTGVFAVQKEHYVLHNLSEFETNYVCVTGQVVKSNTVNYKLNGDIKAIEVVNCDGTYTITKFNSNGTTMYFEALSFVAGDIQTTKMEYTKDGLLDTSVVTLSGTETSIVNTYYENKVQESSNTTVTTFGVKTGETNRTYDTKGQMTLQKIEQWVDSVKTYEQIKEYTDGVMTNQSLLQWEDSIKTFDETYQYEDGLVSSIFYFDKDDNVTATISCDDTGVCILESLVGEAYEVEYNDVTLDYDLDVDGEATTSKIVFPALFTWNIPTVIENIENQVDAIIAAQ